MSIIAAPAFLAALAVRAGLCLLLDLVFLAGLVDSRRGIGVAGVNGVWRIKGYVVVASCKCGKG